MPAYVRRQPLTERIKSYLNPFDFLLWLSEEIESSGWDELEKEWAIPIGVGLNLVFIIARANGKSTSKSYDDIFEDVQGPGLLAWAATFLVHFLTLLSVLNAFYTFWRKRNYRLFEAAVDAVPSTPSAQRVRVDSSPVTSSPLRFLSSILGRDTAQSRAHPDPQRDVWEVSVWDPLPVSLRLFCYFSPGHVLVYWLFLPTVSSDPRPSMTIVTAMLVALLLSFQLTFLQSSFSQQSKDASLISKEVLHEYDTKYVRPRTQPLYRDVGTQFSEHASHSTIREEQYNKVDTYNPMFVINRGFKPSPNPNYEHYTTPDGTPSETPGRKHRAATPEFRIAAQPFNTLSPARPLTATRQPSFKAMIGRGDGGSLGVYSHAASPLRKSASTNFQPRPHDVNGNIRQRDTLSPEKRPSSPEKRKSVPAGEVSTMVASKRWGHLKPDRTRRETGRF